MNEVLFAFRLRIRSRDLRPTSPPLTNHKHPPSLLTQGKIHILNKMSTDVTKEELAVYGTPTVNYLKNKHTRTTRLSSAYPCSLPPKALRRGSPSTRATAVKHLPLP